MTIQEQQQAMDDIYENIPETHPSDEELMDIFSDLFKRGLLESSEEVVNLPRGYGQ